MNLILDASMHLLQGLLVPDFGDRHARVASCFSHFLKNDKEVDLRDKCVRGMQ